MRRVVLVLIVVTLVGYPLSAQSNPEPPGWYAGDMHVHRSCGGSPVSVSSVYNKMATENLAAVSLLADMGNGEVENPTTDLQLVNGKDASVSTPGRIVHWDSEWHWDATYTNYPHQALGGHLVVLGLKEAHQIWEEYTYPILSWAHQQNGIAGFVHMQYLGTGFPTSLDCCTPVEYPVEVALASADFVSEDVDGGDTAIQAYYKLLNSGFRPGLAAGTDYPCNDGTTVGSPLTYVRVADEVMTYRNWIEGISNGRTVVSRNGHSEFLNLLLNGSAGPGDEISLTGGGTIPVTVEWTANQTLSGTIEVVSNGVVVASKQASVTSATSDTLSTTINFTKSGWVVARRMGADGHMVHTAAVFVIVDNLPVRANPTDPQFYVQWTNNLLTRTSPGGAWNWYFPTSLADAQARYSAAKALFQQIASEVAGTAPALSYITVTPGNASISPSANQQFIATGNYADGSSLNITGQVAWASSNPSVAKINLRGLAVAATAGSATITATLGSISGNANATVGEPPSLVSISVAPSNPTVAVGSTQQFTATGTYSDNSTQDISGQVNWASSSTAIASIATSGLATALAPGSSTISATSGSISGSAMLTVQTAALQITTATLPNGILGQSYSASLAASGGILPYAWTVATGSTLPAGISLSTGGQLSGTPSVAGTSSFTVALRDAAGTQVAKVLNLTIAAGSSYNTIWLPTTAPGTVDSGPDSAVELGVRFKSDSDGSIAGIRFYKASTNTGTHVGNLWNSSGTKLASATFSGETTSGWQQVNFATPVAITAGTVYVASYHTNTGHYSDDMNYFASKGVDNAPLHALQDGVSGGNGVYSYGSTSSFPDDTWNSSNYWVDVVFAPAGPDTRPPTVSAVVPSSDSSGIDISSPVTVVFSEAMDSSSITSNTFMLLDNSSAPIQATVAYKGANNTATLIPTSALVSNATYTIVIKGGATDPRVKDIAGNALASDFTSSFMTAAPPPPPPNEGPGGPILVVASSSNPFSRYYGEILRAEGLNEFTVTDISLVSSETLRAYDLVILGDMPLTSSQVAMFSDWVNTGGSMIAMHPDKQLAGVLGLLDTGTTMANTYLAFNTTAGPGVGLVSQTIQFHGTADRYALNGATSLATLYSNATTATPNPAVSLNHSGMGQAAAFAYDLARSVVYTRQGNPAWSGQSRDGESGPIRPDNLFFGAASSDPQPDWVNRSKIAIPQADEQQRLLANLILQMNQTKRPLPRFWYFPNGHKAAVVMTGDDHGAMYSGGAAASRFDQFIAASPAGCSVPDWQCVRATAYIIAPVVASNPLTNAQATNYVAQGFEVAVHVDSVPDCSDWTPSQLESAYTSQLTSFASKYTGVPASQTHRMHCVGWSDYDSQPKTELKHGIRLDTTYYYWPPSWVNDTPGLFTGSGMPMRFTDRTGNLIDVYQATTQMTDESGQSYPSTINTLLNNALGTAAYYGVFTANMHSDSASSEDADQIVASAKSRGVPVISAKQLLAWLDGRNGSSFADINWQNGTLTFTILVGSGANGLQAMLPANADSGPLTNITRNGGAVSYATQTIKGISYAVFPASAGTYEAHYVALPTLTVKSVTLNPSTVGAGTSSTGTVTLSDTTPTSISVSLASNNTAAATVPASTTVNAGSATASFTVSTYPVSAASTVSISATYSGSAASVELNVTPVVALSSLTLNPAAVLGGNSSSGTVALTIAPDTDTVIALQSSDTATATVPATVSVNAGATVATFPITTYSTTSVKTVTISANYNGAGKTATLTVNPAADLSSVTLNPATLTGGASSTGTVTLTVTGLNDTVVSLQSSDTSVATVPATVTVRSGTATATFMVSTYSVSNTRTITVSATYNATTKAASLTVNAANSIPLSTLTLNPRTVIGGNNSTGTVTLTQAAPVGGTTVALSSANTGVATVPANVSVPAGSTTATFTIATSPVAISTKVAITASSNGTKSATLTVNSASLSSVKLSPTGVTGGSPSTGTVTLTGMAPAGGVTLALSSSNTAAATVPANVTVAGGSTTATFIVSTSPVAANTTSTISGIYAGVTRTATLTVRAASLQSMTLSPSTVKGGTSSTGTVSLNGPAAGDVLVALKSNRAYVAVPASVTIAAGTSTATFAISTKTVTLTRTASVSGTYNSVTRSATLTVTP